MRRELRAADKVFCKLDAADEGTFARVNRAVAGVTLRSVVEGVGLLREEYAGHLGVQLMLLPLNRGRASEFARLLRDLRPDEVQLNAPRRAVPRAWTIEARQSRAPWARARAPEGGLGRRGRGV